MNYHIYRDQDDEKNIVITFVGRYEVSYFDRRTKKRWTEYSGKYIR